MNAWARAVTVKIARLHETARMPARDLRIERSTNPWECSCSSCSCAASRSAGAWSSWSPSWVQSAVRSGARRWLTLATVAGLWGRTDDDVDCGSRRLRLSGPSAGSSSGARGRLDRLVGLLEPQGKLILEEFG